MSARPDEEAAARAAGMGDIRFLGEGLDYRVYTAGDLALRFPKSDETASWLVREGALLDAIAPHLPAPVPRFLRCMAPGGGFPRPWVAYRLLRGTQGSLVPDPSRVPGLAASIGGFLSALHAIPMEVVGEHATAPQGHDTWRPEPYRERARLAFDGALRVHGEVIDDPAGSAAAKAFLDGEGGTPPAYEGPERFLHADLDAEHVLLDPASGRVTGVIDWADARAGDPARDLAALLTWGGARFQDGVLASYSLPLDGGFAARAVFLARCYTILDCVEALDEGAGMRAFALRQLARAFEIDKEVRTT